ncbi:MAG TPA: excinuclease ABC subunit A [Spirochaetaceae bacterium]|nr:excinuclease ABC subunit A [Spirochaetaceae bacterium]
MQDKSGKPDKIIVRGARVHNLKNIDVEIPLNKIVGIAGVSGSGKSSLALGVLYAEGSRRYLESLSTYTRRRMTQAAKADVDELLYVPASLALHQRPAVPNIRSTFGTGTELLNSLRLMFSRLSSHKCPNGHYLEPSLNVAAERELACPVCGERFYAPGAEELAFNSQGACPKCDGVGTVRTVDESTLVPDETLTIDEGAVLPWQTLMWSLMKDIARELGVRTDVPFNKLSKKERDIVFYGEPKKHHMVYQMKTGDAGEMDFTYYNAIYTVENALSRVKDEKGMKRVEKFLKEGVCPECHGTRLSEKARGPRLRGISLDEVCKMTLSDAIDWVRGVPCSLPSEMRAMAESICESFFTVAKRLIDLGLGYLTLDRAASTLSTGERQRMQLARSVRNRTTGVLYVLDEPSIGLHPANIKGLNAVMHDLVSDGNSVILVDHDTNILSEADWIIELGPDSGRNGGHVINEGTIGDTIRNERSKIAPFLSGKANRTIRLKLDEDVFKYGEIFLSTDRIHTVRPLEARIPKGRMTVVTGVSGSGKTTFVLESLVPAVRSKLSGDKLPQHIKDIRAEGIRQIKLIDATPIGVNIRSTVATYANVHDELRRVFSKMKSSADLNYKAGDFSYNTGCLRCPTCDGAGSISLDVQFLPDVDIPCPDCHGSRYSKESEKVRYVVKSAVKPNEEYTISQIMAMDINSAFGVLKDIAPIRQKLKVLKDLGLGYLTLGEATPSLSGGEAQRLKLASEMGKTQSDAIFVFDEPTIGLHPLDVQSLLAVFQRLIDSGATVVVIEHDLDVIGNADYIIDMGPDGGDKGGEIVYAGTPEGICGCERSQTGKYLGMFLSE